MAELTLVPPPAEGDEGACPECDGYGWQVDEDRKATRCACQARLAHEGRLAARLVPSRYRRATRASWRGPWPIPPGLDPLIGKPWAVLILGTIGTGKTHCATAYWDSLLTSAPGRQGWWYSFSDAVRQIQSEFGKRDDSGAEPSVTKNRLFSEALLLLDDVGCERPTDFNGQLLRDLLHYRYMHELGTIITSNAESVKSFDAIDPRLTSRFQNNGVEITLKGADWRAA